MIGLFVGKFQPFHNGHLEVVKSILSECGHLKLVIGSSQYHHTENNPFTLEERTEMINFAMQDSAITSYEIHGIEDVHNLPLWADLLIKNFPPFDIVYTGNQRVASILREKGVQVKRQPQFGEASGTEARRRIKSGEPWEELVPPAVASYLKKLNVDARFKNLDPPNPSC